MKSYAEGGGDYSTPYTKFLGTNAEVLFENVLKKKSLNYRGASKKEELRDHWDYQIKSNKSNILPGKYEVKSMKAKSRGQKPDSKIMYIELKSVKGNIGWIYGKSNYIAFQIPDGFLILSREKILNFIRIVINKLPLANESGILWTKYSRTNRDDLVAIFPTNYIINNLPHQIINNSGEVKFFLPAQKY